MTAASVRIELPMRAYPQGSKQAFVAGGRAIMRESSSDGLKAYRTALALLARQHLRGAVFTGPVAVTATFRFKRPKSHYTTKGLRSTAPAHCWPAKRGDVDKLLRATLDALTGPAFHDDAQVIQTTGTVLWDDEDHTTILVEDLTHPDAMMLGAVA